MKSFNRFLAVTTLGLFLAMAASADTLELKDGRVLQGKYLGGTQAVLRFEINGEVQTFRVIEVVAVTFTRSSAGSEVPPPPSAPAPDNGAPQNTAPPNAADNSGPQQAPPPAVAPGGDITLPSGQSILIRMIDSVDSSKNHVGDVFHASLENDLNVNNVLVARRGADIYGRLANAQDAGHLSGSAELQLELMKIVIDGKDFPLVSNDATMRGKGRGGDTAKKVGGGAVAGAIIGAIAGGGRGAAIGAGVGSAAGAGVQVFTKGEKVKVPSETLLEFKLQQPATVTPTQA
jgi:hypothetical protein